MSSKQRMSGKQRMVRRLTVALLGLSVLTACTSGPAPAVSPGAVPPAVTEDGAGTSTIAVPVIGGAGSIATTLPAAATPTKSPVQSGEPAGSALPTNQWWSSALTGPRTQPIWAHPLAVRAADDGLQISSAEPAASANAIITPFRPALTAAGATGAVTVIGYGAFHVVLRVRLRGGGSVDATVVQGSPVLWLRFRGATPALTATGAVRDLGSTPGLARLDVGGQRWDVTGTGLKLTGNAMGGNAQNGNAQNGNAQNGNAQAGSVLAGTGEWIAVARVPDGGDATGWESADPVVQTTAAMTYDAGTGTVTQTLTARRASGRPGVWALLPHQRAGLVAGPEPLAGTYPDALGALSLVRATAVRVRVPMPGLLTGVPRVGISAAARRAVLADLDRDLADPPGAGGSYFGLKELGRLATIAEVARAIGADARAAAALARLRPQLVDWLTFSGPADDRYFGYDKIWGGLIAVPAEFGAQDYNDHHFQYGYLVRAAAVLAAADPGFASAYGDVVDAVVHDYAGSANAGSTNAGSTNAGSTNAGSTNGGSTNAGSAPGFPPFRAFNAYLGHSAASGYAAFADGNNQESSSEAVAAWEAMARWGRVRGNTAMTAYGVTHYAMEAATARAYWLGDGVPRPPGYAHTTAGIVWDAKIDYATWFDPKPESVLGIQLLPLTFGSLYRASAPAAAARSRDLGAAVGGPPRVWGDLFAADLAVADPAAARRRLDAGVPREDSTSRGLVRYWVEALAVLGPPQPAVPAPIGSLTFGTTKNPVRVSAD